jgi:hypothetical protein
MFRCVTIYLFVLFNWTDCWVPSLLLVEKECD